MSLFGRSRPAVDERAFQGLPADAYIRMRRDGGLTGGNTYHVDNDSAQRHSAVWACKRLRANLVSTFPLDVFRTIRLDGADLQIDMPKPPIFAAPGGERWSLVQWLHASQNDLDSAGNAIGLITERNAATTPQFPKGLPARIDLQAISSVHVVQKKDVGLTYRIGNKTYLPEDVWHERQYVVSGLPVGLSPVAYAAWTISESMSMQKFALDWFAGGGVPKARMRNTARKLNPGEIETAKSWWRQVITNGDIMVHGSDWEYDMLQAQQVGSEWLDGRKFGLADIARFFDCPADLIDAAVSGSSVTYANIGQRNLQFLIMSLGPAVNRREEALSTLLPQPRFVKFNTKSLLRMDPETQAKIYGLAVKARWLAPSEIRQLENRAPFTDSQISEFVDLFGAPSAVGTSAPVPAGPIPNETGEGSALGSSLPYETV